LAFSKKQKNELVSQYSNWLEKSEAVFMVEFNKMTMKEVDSLRAKVRDAGGEVHVVKNTLMSLALKSTDMPVDTKMVGSSLAGFSHSDPPMLAKIFSDAAKNSEIFKIKGGYLGVRALSAVEVKALADLPPLPVMRATLLGLLQTPASKLVRTLAEPARSLASVLKAYADKGAAQPA